MDDSDYLELIGEPPAKPDSAQSDFVTGMVLADFLGVSSDVVAALGREGVLPRHVPPGWKNSYAYDLKACVRAYVGHLRIKAASKMKPTVTPGLDVAKLELMTAQARKVELQNDKAAGRLIPVQDVRAEWLAAASDLRNRLLAVAPRIAASLSLDRPAASALDREIRAAMADLATDGGSPL